MTSNQRFYQLLLAALVLVCLISHVWWPDPLRAVLAHASLRVPLAEPTATKGNGSAKRWQPWTPAMAGGLTDHVWSLREVLMFRVPPWPQPQTV